LTVPFSSIVVCLIVVFAISSVAPSAKTKLPVPLTPPSIDTVPETIFKYRYENLSDNIEISGEVVDEDGYYIPFFKGGNQTIGEKFRAEDVIEVTNIRPKMSFR
jgi:hypothetical protein